MVILLIGTASQYPGNENAQSTETVYPFKMNKLNPKKLVNSKWTAVNPEMEEKHFLVTEVEYDENGAITHCLIEAVMTRRSMSIAWRALGNDDQWICGWH